MKKAIFLLFLLSTIFFSGCIQNVQNISSNGLTVSISANQISSSLEDHFPVIQNFQYGSIELSNPKVILKKGSNRIITGTTIAYSNDLIPSQRGTLYISGSPYFNAQTGEIYLKSPKIEKLNFNGYNLFDYVQKPLIYSIQPIINNIFLNNPIYRLDDSTISNSLIKDISVLNGELLVTFGL